MTGVDCRSVVDDPDAPPVDHPPAIHVFATAALAPPFAALQSELAGIDSISGKSTCLRYEVIPLCAGDVLLLASDGLHGAIDDAVIAGDVARPRRRRRGRPRAGVAGRARCER